jgi:hypothetical protein
MKDSDKAKAFDRFEDAIKSRVNAQRASERKVELWKEGRDVSPSKAHLAAKGSGADAVFEVDPKGKAAVRYSVETEEGPVSGLTAIEALKKLRQR